MTFEIFGCTRQRATARIRRGERQLGRTIGNIEKWQDSGAEGGKIYGFYHVG